MRSASFFILIFGVAILASSCLGTRYLKENETLLYKQKVDVDKPLSVDAFEELQAQQPNRQFPILPFSPYVWFYQIGEKKFDVNELESEKSDLRAKYDTLTARETSPRKQSKLINKRNRKVQRIDRKIKEGNVWMRWGEPLAVYDSSLTSTTIQKYKLYLQSEGYFDAQISTDENQLGKLTSVKYTIREGQPYLIDSIAHRISDSLLTTTLNKRKSLINIGNNYRQSTLSDEREQINNLLKDNGYYDFSRQYISFDVDTTYRDHGVAVRTVIKNPIGSDNHKQFVIDSVNFVINHTTDHLNDSIAYHVTYKNTKYLAHQPYYSPKVLHRRTFIHKGDLYSRTNTFDTQRQLANLDVFKFVNVNYDSTGGKFIANIFTQPLPRYQWTNEFGINVNQGFPGPFYNTTFKKRNIFRGLENFELSGRIGIEGVAAASDEEDVFRSIEAGANAALIFPQFVLPIKNTTREKLAYLNPKTKLSIGYSHTNRPEYNRDNGNFTTTYSWGRQLNTSYNFTLADVSIIDSDLTTDFQQRLIDLRNNGSNLINSFNPSFVSSMSFFIIKNFNNYGIGKHNSSYLQVFLESGGTTGGWFPDNVLNDQNLETYKYGKVNIDFRKVTPVTKKAAVAFRINAGIALPYGDNNILPYEKYFFAGGSNGIRGWRPRRLGPGSYTPTNNEGTLSYQFEQQGEMILQASLEFRRNLFGFVDWAYFVDAGNIWMLVDDPSRPGAQFRSENFYREIAVASGLGLRFDFVFLIIRLDAGLKVIDPARPEGKRFIFNEGFKDAPFDNRLQTEPVIFNIGIGYPF